MDKIKVVILCGGAGTRLREQTEFMPKPLVQIGDKPILWHIMKIYAHYGLKDFILCLGYKGDMLRQYFLNYKMINCDFTINLGAGDVAIHNSHDEYDWDVTLAQTGENAMTGSRVKRIEKYIDSSLFMLTYGDGVADVNIAELLEFHKSHGKIGTVTGVHPSSRFASLVIENDRVVDFLEKPQLQDGLINGGFFVFDRRLFSYLDDSNCILEKEPLERLTADGELCVYKHTGFWACMDTQRDFQLLNNIWNSGAPPWKVW